MRTFGLFEAKQKLSELVPAVPETSLKEIFDDIEKIRKRARQEKGVNVRTLIEEGRT